MTNSCKLCGVDIDVWGRMHVCRQRAVTNAPVTNRRPARVSNTTVLQGPLVQFAYCSLPLFHAFGQTCALNADDRRRGR